jgi:hypothetical protein
LGTTLGTGESYELSVTASGSPTLAYQWRFNDMDILNATTSTYTIVGATHGDEGEYSVLVTNPFGMAPSDPASVIVRDSVPGLFNTGVDATGISLADGETDPHYIFLVNPNGAPLDPAIVEDSTRFPIVAGPWLANTETSKWIGPAFFTDTAAGAADDSGNYSYAISFDLTGFDLSNIVITGDWATDNAGVDILLNGVSTANENTNQFVSLTPFTISAGFQAGPNSLEFIVNNAAAGYTGLRVENLRGLGTLLPTVDLPELTIVRNGAGNPVISFTGQLGTTYRLERSISLQTNQWADLGQLIVPGDGMVSYEDTNAPTGDAFYRVTVAP